MDFELRQAQRRFEKEQRDARERARLKAERQRKAEADAEARRSAEAAAQREARQAEAARVAQALQQDEADREAGAGIAFRRVLTPMPVPGPGDKMTLPASALEALPLDLALQRGPMLFQVSAQHGARAGMQAAELGPEDEGAVATHAGVREFTAPEGCVGLPEHVLRNLTLRSMAGEAGGRLHREDPAPGAGSRSQPSVQHELSQVCVRYVKLPKGTFAQLQPVGAVPRGSVGFAHLVADQRAALEAHLRNFATLSVGDVLAVPSGGQTFDLRVIALKPEDQVSVIDTDMEVDILPPPSHLPSAPAGTPTSFPETAPSAGLLPDAASQLSAVALPVGQAVAFSVEEGQWRYFRLRGPAGAGPQLAGADAGLQDLAIEVSFVGPPAGVDQAQLGHSSSDLVDVDVYASFPPIARPSLLDHQAAAITGVGPKTLVLPASALLQAGAGEGGGSPASLAPLHCIVGVFARRGSCQASILARFIPVQGTLGQELAAADREQHVRDARGANGAGAEDLAECPNCSRLLPARTLLLHEAYCRRHNTVCPVPSCEAVMLRTEVALHQHCRECGELVADVRASSSSSQRNQAPASSSIRGDTHNGDEKAAALASALVAKHMETAHGTLVCPCGAQLPLAAMAVHRRTVCPERWILCRFCGSCVSAEGTPSLARDSSRGLTGHEARCGARTAPCDSCGASVMLKDLDLHSMAFHSAASPAGATREPFSAPPLAPSGAGGASILEGVPNTPGSRGTGAGLAEAGSSPFGAAMGTFSAKEAPEVAADSGTTLKSTLNVSCPICGERVHSERDLSHHFDLVH